jgi:hypothetical protein
MPPSSTARDRTGNVHAPSAGECGARLLEVRRVELLAQRGPERPRDGIHARAGRIGQNELHDAALRERRGRQRGGEHRKREIAAVQGASSWGLSAYLPPTVRPSSIAL